MYLIVGLGNPERDYSKTRHNMGFNVLNEIAKDFNFEINKNRFKALYEKYSFEGENYIFIKPQTFMNLSGESVKAFVDYYKINSDNIVVIYDDVDLEPGEIRIRKKGSSGGHNGIKSIINELGTEDFSRIRIGIGKPEKGENMIEYVIGHIPDDDKEKLELRCKKSQRRLGRINEKWCRFCYE